MVDVVTPFKDKLKASIVFPSMPEVMRLNKLGSFSMAQLGQSKSIIGKFPRFNVEVIKYTTFNT